MAQRTTTAGGGSQGITNRLANARHRVPPSALRALVLVAVTLLVGVPLAGAAPGDAPEVSTPVVVDITLTNAVALGDVNPNGLETTYRFEYRRAADVDWSSAPDPALSIGDGTESQGVGADLEGLDPSTEYVVRLVATNDTGTTTSDEVTFETLPEVPPEVTTPTVDGITPLKATFRGNVDANGLETTYHFEYRKAVDVDWISVPESDDGAGQEVDPREVEQQAQGLDPSTEYVVRLVATNQVGSTTSDEVTFETAATFPPEVTTPTVDGITPVKATFRAGVDANGLETGYHFEYRRAVDVDWISVPEPDDGAGDGMDSRDVEQQVQGLDASTEYVVRVVATNDVGAVTSDEATFETLPAVPPEVTTPTVDGITSLKATFRGNVDANGLDTGYRFEYRRAVDVDWTSVPEADEPIGDGFEPQEVAQEVVNLEPGTAYVVRLVATNDAGTTLSDEEAFETLPPLAPSVAVPNLTDVTQTGARLVGGIDPHELDIVYRFEYQRAGDADWISVPQDDQPLGSTTSVTVSQQLEGLQVGTQYRARLAATSLGGTSTSAIRTFTTRSANPLPPTPERPYEMITPVDKNGGDASSAGFVDRDHVYLVASQSFLPSDPALGVAGKYLATRSDDGWSHTSGILAAGDPTGQAFHFGTVISDFTEDLSLQIVTGLNAMLPEDQDERNDVYLRGPGGLSLVSTGSLDDGNVRGDFMGATPDGRHILFTSSQVLEAGDAGRTSGKGLYERVNGQTRVVGVDSDEAMISESGATLAGDSCLCGSSNAMSEDGSRIFFSSPDPNEADSQLYVRINGEDTVHVSAPQRSEPGNAPQHVAFQGASDDGSVVFFTTTGQLVDDDVDESNDLYRFELASKELTRVSGGPDGDVHAADVLGVAAVSADGSRAYFTARGVVAPGGVALDGGEDGNLYFYDHEESTTQYIATSSSGLLNQSGLAFPSYASATPDGGTFVFPSTRRLTAFDNAGLLEWYRYQAETGETICVSCNTTGEEPLGEVDGEARFRAPWGTDPTKGQRAPRIVSDDGSTVAFATTDALLPRDTNGRRDVYVWREGDLSLLTLGSAPGDALFADMTPDGRDLMFTTYDRLVPQDRDGYIDLYVARTGGGFPVEPERPGCSGDGCQGDRGGRPPLGAPGSDSVRGRGDLDPGRRASLSVARISRADRTRLARGGTIALKVRVSRAGRVRVVARARVNGRGQVVAAASKRARRAGIVRIPVRLTKAALGQLARRSKLRVVVSVRFSGVREPDFTVLNLKRSGSAAPRRAASSERPPTAPSAPSDGASR